MTSGVLLLAGPTASGKTELAIALAQRYDAEIVSADSRQIYRGMPIGTAAPTESQRARVPHHLVAFIDPHERYSAGRFVADALRTIDEIHARGKRAIVAGGTGFYVRALAGDVALAPAGDERVRERLAREARVHPPEVLHAWLAVRDPQRAASLTSADRYRVLRALEIALAPSAGNEAPQKSLRSRGIPYRKAWIEIDERELAGRIAARTDAMLAAGLVEEAERVGPRAVAADAVGYLEAMAYGKGLLTYSELRQRLTRTTRRYAKRQRTWFRTEPDIVSIPPEVTALETLARTLPGWV